MPRRVFIDTCIIREHHCAFSSSQLAAFSKTVSRTGTTLLLPQVIEREIQRQFDEVISIENKRWAKLAQSPHLKDLGLGPFPSIETALRNKLRKNWDDFLGSFSQVLRIDYSGIDVAVVMEWYEQGLAPFGKGNKKSEFPDAFAIAALLEAGKRLGPIDVVSTDGDFESACKRWPDQLIHRPSLGALAELYTRSRDPDVVEQVHAVLGSGETGPFVDAVAAYFPDLWFLLDEVDGEVEDIEVSSLSDVDFDVMLIDDDDIVVAYSAQLHWTASVSFADPDSFFSDSESPRGGVYMGTLGGTVEQTTLVEGTFGIVLNKDGISYSVNGLSIDEHDIHVALDEGAELTRRDDDLRD